MKINRKETVTIIRALEHYRDEAIRTADVAGLEKIGHKNPIPSSRFWVDESHEAELLLEKIHEDLEARKHVKAR